MISTETILDQIGQSMATTAGKKIQVLILVHIGVPGRQSE